MVEASNTEASDSSSSGGQGIKQRRSRWKSSWDACQYLNRISRDKFRQSDKTTSLLLAISIAALIPLLVAPLTQEIRLVGICGDILLFVALLHFVANRFGIVTALPEREAVLVWDLMIGMLVLGLVLAANIGVFLMGVGSLVQ